MLADGGEAISDLAVLRDRGALFGPVASDPTAWRLLSGMDGVCSGGCVSRRVLAAEGRVQAWMAVNTWGRMGELNASSARATGSPARPWVGSPPRAVTIREAVLSFL
jgi:hypothetical protein